MLYRIGEFSKIAMTTIKALRSNDGAGLLKPSYVEVTSAAHWQASLVLFCPLRAG